MPESASTRIDRLEKRVDKIEDNIAVHLQRIFEALEELKVDGVKNACPSPGACVGLGQELQHAITAHNATMLRVERLELKLLDMERTTMTEFHKIEKQKAWVLGMWSALAFFGSVVGAALTILINYYLNK